MRHVTWAAAWFLVGLAVVLGTASLLEQRAAVADRGPVPRVPAAAPAPGFERVKVDQGRQLVAYRQSAYTRQQQDRE
jgi:hypothetical protein